MKSNRRNYKSRTSRKSGKTKSQRRLALVVILIIVAASVIAGKFGVNIFDSLTGSDAVVSNSESIQDTFGSEDLPESGGELYVEVNDNVPTFPEEAYTKAGLTSEDGKWVTESDGNESGTGVLSTGIDSDEIVSYEYYGELDRLGRCTIAYGCLSPDTMPEDGEERGDISSVHPSGWASGQNWERGHLIAWALSAENANELNLVTSTHQMNVEAVKPFEEQVEHYIWDTGNHVLYMARPWYNGNELIPRGVQMSAWSVDDSGASISFNVYCFNETKNADINYYNGIVTYSEESNNSTEDTGKSGGTTGQSTEDITYVLNTNSMKFHYPTCDSVNTISENNRKDVSSSREELIKEGYEPCGSCQP